MRLKDSEKATTANIGTNIVYEHLCNSKKRFIVEQGGTRSGKTYNILIWIIFHYCQNNTGKIVSIVRKTQPSLHGSAMKDFLEILMDTNLYNPAMHNKTRNIYYLMGNEIEFIAADDPQKMRGRRRHLCFCNEANELTYEDFKQLNFRTAERMILDYNPSDVFHWIYDELIPRKDENGESEVDFFQTTYKDNPFLPKSLVREIESLQEVDPDAWLVYGLGDRAVIKDIIYTNWNRIGEIPEDAQFKGFGLDFGFAVDETALVGVWEMNNDIYVKQFIYEKGQVVEDTAKKILEIQDKYDLRGLVFADNARPDSIEILLRNKVKAIGAKKGKGSIIHGIDLLKSRKIYITDDSKDILKEIQMYKWRIDRNGNNTGEPVDKWNHTLDAMRYWAVENIRRANYGKYTYG